MFCRPLQKQGLTALIAIAQCRCGTSHTEEHTAAITTLTAWGTAAVILSLDRFWQLAHVSQYSVVLIFSPLQKHTNYINCKTTSLTGLPVGLR